MNGDKKMFRKVADTLRATACLSTMSDEALLTAHVQGSTTAFAEIVGRYQQELFTFLVRFMGDRTAADDIFQDTFVQIHQSARTFDPARRLRPWLFTIAANKARDAIRARNRHKTIALQTSVRSHSNNSDACELVTLLASDDAGPVAVSTTHESAERVHTALQQLPARYQQILTCAYFQQLPYQHIADQLGIPLGTVKSRVHAAVEAFAKIYNDLNPK
jgi:RNA polymerase sigma-70 factor, ECF subfamily